MNVVKHKNDASQIETDTGQYLQALRKLGRRRLLYFLKKSGELG